MGVLFSRKWAPIKCRNTLLFNGLTLCLSLLIFMGRRALGQAAKLRCGGSNPPGASNPYYVRTGGYSDEATLHCRPRREPSSAFLGGRESR
ncbi:hypothetical protein NSPZN2_10431 [Nitrospira defluvii]|uniref:Secreted protein n=1 Tax=Nitrospira defluvii TaxID=330214 RepID=A0ABM8QGR5_9BACT|nr:hypothetical protein NSPZN2_10431 [Nitrospira defluvii]